MIQNGSSLNKLALYAALGVAGYALARSIANRYSKLDLNGKVVLITGGSRGLGLVLARKLSDLGARVAICARNIEQLGEAHLELTERGAEVISLTADVTDRAQVYQLIDKVMEQFGRIDVLINNAGIIQIGPQEALSVEDYEKAMDTNFWAALYTTLAILPHFKNQNGGRIINVASIGGKIAVPHMLPYTVSKHALVGLSEGMHAELKKHNIIVTTVVPNLIRTGSPRNVTVKGKHELEYAWFKISDSSPLFSQSPERAASQIIDAIQYGKAEIFLSGAGKMAAITQALAPGLMSSLMSLINRMLPNNGARGMQSKKGYESESFLSRAFGKESTQAAIQNNET